LGEADVAVENASVDRPVDQSHFDCQIFLQQSQMKCRSRHFSLGHLIEIIERASPASKGKSTGTSNFAESARLR